MVKPGVGDNLDNLRASGQKIAEFPHSGAAETAGVNGKNQYKPGKKESAGACRKKPAQPVHCHPSPRSIIPHFCRASLPKAKIPLFTGMPGFSHFAFGLTAQTISTRW